MISISSALKKVSLFYVLVLLGTYAVNKTLIFFDLGIGFLSIVDRVVILPMGCMAILYLASSVRVVLEESGVHHKLYEILIMVFTVLLLAAFLFVSFLPA